MNEAIRLPRAELRQALAVAAKVVERRSNPPILGHVLLRGGPDGIALTGTDLDLAVTVRLRGAANENIAVALPAYTFRDLERKALAGAEVALSVEKPATLETRRKKEYVKDDKGRCVEENGKLKEVETNETYDVEKPGRAAVYFGAMKCGLPTAFEGNFPDLRIERSVHGDLVIEHSINADFVLPTADFLSGLLSTQFAISTEETRYYLNGIFMHAVEPDGCGNGAKLRMVATDGHRLAHWETPAPAGAAQMPGMIVPRKTVNLLIDLCKAKGAPENVRIEVNSIKARFTVGNVTIVTKLIDGTFPDYQRVIPLGNNRRVTFDTAELLTAVKAVSVMRGERGPAVKLSVDCKDGGQATVSVKNANDAIEASMPVGCYSDSLPFDEGFNASYLAEILERVAGERVTFAFAQRLSDEGCRSVVTGAPVLIQDEARANVLFVLMPMRV